MLTPSLPSLSYRPHTFTLPSRFPPSLPPYPYLLHTFTSPSPLLTPSSLPHTFTFPSPLLFLCLFFPIAPTLLLPTCYSLLTPLLPPQLCFSLTCTSPSFLLSTFLHYIHPSHLNLPFYLCFYLSCTSLSPLLLTYPPTLPTYRTLSYPTLLYHTFPTGPFFLCLLPSLPLPYLSLTL